MVEFASMRSQVVGQVGERAARTLRRLKRLAAGPEAPALANASSHALANARLTASVSSPGSSSDAGSPGSLFGATLRRLKKKALGDSDFERTVVPWQPDEEALTCPLCGTSFGLFVRKYHCRLCGAIYCANCTDRPVAFEAIDVLEPAPGAQADAVRPAREGSVRACTTCFNAMIFLLQRSHIRRAGASAAPYMEHYELIQREKRAIRDLLPEYEALTRALQANRNRYFSDEVAADAHRKHMERESKRAADVQKAIVLKFRRIEALAKAANALPTESAETAKVQKSILMWALIYMQVRSCICVRGAPCVALTGWFACT